ncbi:hypothetical protein HDE_02075 [Halotydeus destructor]|nr:hypothetical protein HDE_02075 [Halotydeus destructor]
MSFLMLGLVLYPLIRMIRGIKNFWAGDKAIADTIAGDLKVFLLIDTDIRDPDKIRSNWKKAKFFLVKTLVVFVHWFTFMRFIVLEMTTDDNKLNMMGEVYRYFGGSRKYYTATALFLNFFGIYLPLYSWIYQKRKANKSSIQLWLRPLEVISGRLPPESIGLKESNMADIRRRARWSSHIIFVFTYLTSFAYFILIPRIYLVYYPKDVFNKYWPLLVVWKIQFDVSTFLIMGTLSTSLCYFSLLCLVYRERYQNINVTLVRNFKVSDDMRDGDSKRLDKIETSLLQHNDICVDLERSNHYWSHFIVASFLTYIPLICIIMFQLLFVKKKYYFKITLIVMLVQYFSMLTGTCLSAATVSNRALRGHPKYCSLVSRYKIPFSTRMNYMRLLTRFEGEAIGFSCHDLFTLTDETYSKIFKLITSGLTQIFWENVDLSTHLVSDQCAAAINGTLDGLENGDTWSYELLDASAKGSAGLLDGTISSFGDFDQCLSVKADHSDIGQYGGAHCMVRLALTSGDSSIAKAVGKLPIFEYFHPTHALCVPSPCSAAEVHLLVTQVLADMPDINVHGKFVCDTAESISYSHRLKNLTKAQIISLTLLTLILVLVILSSARELLYTASGVPKMPDDRLQAFSALANSAELAKDASRGSGYFYIAELNKIGLIMFGIAGHSLSCLETIPGWYVITRMRKVTQLFSVWWINGMLNENGLGMVAVVGGFATYWTVSPVIRKGKFNYLQAVKDRWLKFVPIIMALVAMEIVWPLIGAGPYYTRVANHLLTKCTNNAWMNFVFINNFKSAPENCAPHLFYSSIELQLFILAIGVVYVTVKRPRLGVSIIIGLIVLGNATLATMVWIRGSSPVLVDAHGSVNMTIKYLDFAHFATYGQLSNYMFGVLTAYILKETRIPFTINPVLRYSLWIYANIVLGTVHFLPAIHNTWQLLTPMTIPVYMIGIKLLYTTAQAVMLFFYYPFMVKDQSAVADPKADVTPKTKDTSKATNTFSARLRYVTGNMLYETGETVIASPLVRVVMKLSLGMYFVNYYLIRLDFFTTRVTYALSMYIASKRVFYTLILSLAGAYLFHIFFIAPFEKLRKILKAGSNDKNDNYQSKSTKGSLGDKANDQSNGYHDTDDKIKAE